MPLHFRFSIRAQLRREGQIFFCHCIAWQKIWQRGFDYFRHFELSFFCLLGGLYRCDHNGYSRVSCKKDGLGEGTEVTFTIIQMGEAQPHCLSSHYCTDVGFFQLGMHLCRREIFMLQKTRPSQLWIRASSTAYSCSLTFASTLHSQLLKKILFGLLSTLVTKSASKYSKWPLRLESYEFGW